MAAIRSFGRSLIADLLGGSVNHYVRVTIPRQLKNHLDEVDQLPRTHPSFPENGDTIHALDTRRKILVEHSRQFFHNESIFPTCPVLHRSRLPWLNGEYIKAYDESMTHAELFWAEGINKYRNFIIKDRNVEKANKILKNLKKYNERKLSFTPAANSRLIVVDPTKVRSEKGVPYPRNLGANALPNGVIFLNKYMVEEFPENILAFAIAHELTHAFANHVAEAASINVSLELINHHSYIAMRKNLAADMNQSFDDMAPMLMSENRGIFPENDVFETEADRIGTMMMAEAYYNPGGANDYFSDTLGYERCLFSEGFEDPINKFFQDEDEVEDHLADLWEDDAKRRHVVDRLSEKREHRFKSTHPEMLDRQKYTENIMTSATNIYTTRRRDLVRDLEKTKDYVVRLSITQNTREKSKQIQKLNKQIIVLEEKLKEIEKRH